MAAKKKKVSIGEFRAWLDGVEEMQSPDWTPTKTQWKLIRSKINSIKEAELQVIASNPVYPQHTSAAPVTQNASDLTQFGITPPPSDHGMGGPASIDMSPAAKAILSPTDGKSKTPNIDTADGNFESTFK